jgi:predicted deacylase
MEPGCRINISYVVSIASSQVLGRARGKKVMSFTQNEAHKRVYKHPAVSSEHGNELPGTIQAREFSDKLSDCQLHVGSYKYTPHLTCME